MQLASKQEAAKLGTPLVLVVLFWRGKYDKNYKISLEHHSSSPNERPPSGRAIFFSGNKNMCIRILPAKLPSAASTETNKEQKAERKKEIDRIINRKKGLCVL
jgi:hypothetical protein